MHLRKIALFWWGEGFPYGIFEHPSLWQSWGIYIILKYISEERKKKQLRNLFALKEFIFQMNYFLCSGLRGRFAEKATWKYKERHITIYQTGRKKEIYIRISIFLIRKSLIKDTILQYSKQKKYITIYNIEKVFKPFIKRESWYQNISLYIHDYNSFLGHCLQVEENSSYLHYGWQTILATCVKIIQFQADYLRRQMMSHHIYETHSGVRSKRFYWWLPGQNALNVFVSRHKIIANSCLP